MSNQDGRHGITRGEFLKATAFAAAGAAVPAVAVAHAPMSPIALAAARTASNEEAKGLKAVYALRYGELGTWPNYGVFWMGDPRFSSNQPVTPIAMYFWLIQTSDHNILVDTGCGPDWASRYNPYETPESLLTKVGLKPTDIDTVIISHPHFDHVDALPLFTKATTYIQRAAYQFTTEGAPESSFLRTSGFPRKKDSLMLLEMLWDGRLKLLDGDIELFPGIRVIKVDGHFPGLMITVVQTKAKPVILASDSVHQYVELERNIPTGMYQGSLKDTAMAMEIVSALDGIVVAGHDKAVMQRFKPEKEGVYRVY